MKTLVINQIEILNDGTIQIRMSKLSSDGDLIGYHRTSVAPGGDVDAQFAAVNAHMEQEGFAPVSAEDIARVKAHTAIAQTPEAVAAYKARQESTAALAKVA